MEQLTSIDIVIATHRPAGIARVAEMSAPTLPGVRYVVSWQNHENAPIPEALNRPDMTVLRLNSSGLSRNRNNALEHCQADAILIADDDITIFPKGVIELQKYYAEHPEADFVTFQTLPTGRKIYPSSEIKLFLPLPKGYYANSTELSWRRRLNLRFCPELGLGSERFQGGEDEAILVYAIRQGFDCRYVPICMSSHPNESTGTKAKLTDSNLLAFGLVIALQYPLSAILRIPLKAWRVSRKGQASFFRALLLGYKGAITLPALRRRNPDTIL